MSACVCCILTSLYPNRRSYKQTGNKLTSVLHRFIDERYTFRANHISNIVSLFYLVINLSNLFSRSFNVRKIFINFYIK